MDGSGFGDADLGADFSAQQDQTRRLVRAIMRVTGLSASALARAAGLTPSTVNRFIHQDVRHTLSQRTLLSLMIVAFDHLKTRPLPSFDRSALDELARAIPVFERALAGHDPANRLIIETIKGDETPLTRAQTVDDIAVLTIGATGVDAAAGNFRGAMLRTPRPPFLAADDRAFAILMPDASMAPRFDSGDLLYVSPARPAVAPGMDVVAILPVGGFVVGRLRLAGTQRDIVPLDDARGRTISSDQTTAIYPIVGSHRP